LSQNPGVAKREVASTETSLKRAGPPLKWAGGKRWLIPQLEALWKRNETRRYVEPFCGGLAAALGLMPAAALLNDINPHLINFYKQIQTGLQVRIEMRNDETLFYEHRRRFNELISKRRKGTSEAAQLFYYLNRTCFNGLCRFNQRGEFNVPFGTYNSINYARDFTDLTSVFKDWTFSNCDISTLALESGDFVYADPPYDVEFTTYSAGGFTWDDQVRTAELLSKHRGPVVISNQATERVVSLYQKLGFTVHYLYGPRRISCTGDRTVAKEVLAVNRALTETALKGRSE
jgi:DNA adenine methylase